MLEPGWVDEHADEFDVMHVHFGFDAVSPEDLADVVPSLRRHGKPLVITVHDLRNPHHHEREAARRPARGPGRGRGRRPDPDSRRRRGDRGAVGPRGARRARTRTSSRSRGCRGRGRAREDFVIGVHAKSLRAGMDPLPVIEEIVANACPTSRGPGCASTPTPTS